MLRHFAGLAGAGALVLLGLITAAPAAPPPQLVVLPEVAAAVAPAPTLPPGTMDSGAPTDGKPGEPAHGAAPAAPGTG